jgi:hypothetical protein
MTPSRLLAALVLSLSFGCAEPAHFVGRGIPQSRMNRDVAACENYAETNNWGYQGIAGRNRFVRIYNNCMLEKGYEMASN